MERIEIPYLEQVLKSTDCTKVCPFCIAKAYRFKFANMHEGKDNFEKNDEVFQFLQDNNVFFSKGYYLSGQGEPSLYSKETLEQIFTSVKKKISIFNNKATFCSSGHIFNEIDKVEMIQHLLGDCFKILVLRVAFDAERDRTILNYEKDYLNTDTFKSSNNVVHIGLTKHINPQTFSEDLERFIEENPSVSQIEIKTLAQGPIDTQQTKWLKKNGLNNDEELAIYDSLVKRFNPDNVYNFNINGTNVRKFYSSKLGNEVVLTGGVLVNYEGSPITIQKLEEINNGAK